VFSVLVIDRKQWHPVTEMPLQELNCTTEKCKFHGLPTTLRNPTRIKDGRCNRAVSNDPFVRSGYASAYENLKNLWKERKRLMNEQTTANKTTKHKLLPYPVLVLATGGDVDAINAVVKHYEGYIAVLATRQLYDERGNPHLCVDEGLRRRLETKLITGILAFDLKAAA